MLSELDEQNAGSDKTVGDEVYALTRDHRITGRLWSDFVPRRQISLK